MVKAKKKGRKPKTRKERVINSSSKNIIKINIGSSKDKKQYEPSHNVFSISNPMPITRTPQYVDNFTTQRLLNEVTNNKLLDEIKQQKLLIQQNTNLINTLKSSIYNDNTPYIDFNNGIGFDDLSTLTNSNNAFDDLSSLTNSNSNEATRIFPENEMTPYTKSFMSLDSETPYNSETILTPNETKNSWTSLLNDVNDNESIRLIPNEQVEEPKLLEPIKDENNFKEEVTLNDEISLKNEASLKDEISLNDEGKPKGKKYKSIEKVSELNIPLLNTNPKLENAEVAELEEPKKRGRPLGSKNKYKPDPFLRRFL